jgi:hypothetical protein
LYNGFVNTALPGTTIYTVPAGFRVVLRTILWRNQAATTNLVYLRLNNTLTIFSLNLGASGASGGSPQSDFWVVLQPGHTLQLATTAAAGFNAVVSGSIYSI